MAMNWTPEQTLAIEVSGVDVLLTASAGSGKTAALAERCVYLLTEAERPCGIDDLLVLTFTEAAAAEMRTRIREKLRERAGVDRRLYRQLRLLDKADISTIHAFCNNVLREFFYLLGLDGAYAIMDSDDADMLKGQIAEDFLEEQYGRVYEAGDESLLRFLQAYTSATSDAGLARLIIRLRTFLESVVDQQRRQELWRQAAAVEKGEDLEALAILKQQQQAIRGQLRQVIARLRYAKELTGERESLAAYRDFIRERLTDYEDLCRALDEGDDAAALARIREYEIPRLPGLSGKLVAEAEKQRIKGHLDKAREAFKQARDEWATSREEIVRQLRMTGPFAEKLTGLQEAFQRRYQQVKQRQNVLDFSDLEQLCLDLIRGEHGGALIRQLSRRYRHILVDEYQDTSPVQEAIIEAVNRTEEGGSAGKLFMVGDVKQSIYGFRRADPDIFLGKYRAFAALAPGVGGSPTEACRIDLNRNFRSRQGVIEGINAIFSRCMTREFGGLDYAGEARLTYGASYYDEGCANPPSPTVELHLLEKKGVGGGADDDNHEEAEEGVELDATRLEALAAARRIRRMLGLDRPGAGSEFEVYDKRSGAFRPLEFRDISVLLRSVKIKAEMWVEVFEKMGIPVHAELSSGFFVATEVQDMLSLFRLLDNPRQDIPLAAVLRSPLVGLSESDLAWVRLSGKDEAFHHAVLAYAREGDEQGRDKARGRALLRERLAEFVRHLDAWRDLARRGSCAELVWQIYRDRNYLAYVSGLPEGRQRYNNLLHLHDLARRFDGFWRLPATGLTRFVRFVEKLRAEEGDYGPAPVVTDADNLVRIMSVHKSKGLEFPVVIVGGLGHRFNLRDARESVLPGRGGQDEAGLGLQAVDPETRDRWETLGHRLAAETITQRSIEEEQRVLYVAMTRAREKLILSGTCDLEKCRESWVDYGELGVQSLPEFVLRAAQMPLDWIVPALAGHPDTAAFFGRPARGRPREDGGRFEVQVYDEEAMQELAGGMEPVGRGAASSRLEDLAMGPAEVGAAAQSVLTRLAWRYPYQAATETPARRSVTDVKHHLALEQEEGFATEGKKGWYIRDTKEEAGAGVMPGFELRLSSFASEPTRADVGTWTHLLLEKLDLAGALNVVGLRGQLDGIVERGLLREDDAAHIDLEGIERFFVSEVGREMLEHRESLRREWSFTLALPARADWDLDGPLRVVERDADRVIVRGVIDAMYRTERGWVIVDYKTDRVDEWKVGERAESYRVSMLLYRRAVEGILHEDVCREVLYFLRPGAIVDTQDEDKI